MPVCGPYPLPILPYLTFLLPVNTWKSTLDVSFPKGCFLSTSSFHPKARPRLWFYNAIINLACLHHNFTLLLIYVNIPVLCQGKEKSLGFFCCCRFVFLSSDTQFLGSYLPLNRHSTELTWTILNLLSGLEIEAVGLNFRFLRSLSILKWFKTYTTQIYKQFMLLF